ncbi:hypothetical protein CERZMDRAFT_97817 [Cercospora zeae-maydis SCOH1-5]|uniref:Uncharacterized protein n=1 Tax=Cercospora zeae-maydis SCOH1-5 TaxID=717836 RepID=A0A6A6FF78_9PEZI|nr:hypothetical protein CERZMDRAFT_97817 [Cercospora zeae-maydis SCOH1-5]
MPPNGALCSWLLACRCRILQGSKGVSARTIKNALSLEPVQTGDKVHRTETSSGTVNFTWTEVQSLDISITNFRIDTAKSNASTRPSKRTDFLNLAPELRNRKHEAFAARRLTVIGRYGLRPRKPPRPIHYGKRRGFKALGLLEQIRDS